MKAYTGFFPFLLLLTITNLDLYIQNTQKGLTEREDSRPLKELRTQWIIYWWVPWVSSVWYILDLQFVGRQKIPSYWLKSRIATKAALSTEPCEASKARPKMLGKCHDAPARHHRTKLRPHCTDSSKEYFGSLVSSPVRLCYCQDCCVVVSREGQDGCQAFITAN